MLALEGRYESFTLGKDVSVEQVTEISGLAKKHGFRLAGYRSFERAVTEEYIQTVRQNAARKKKPRPSSAGATAPSETSA